MQVRLLAAQVLDAVVHRGRSLKSELAGALPRLSDARDRALLEAIAFTALRGRHRYMPALRGWLQKPPGANDGPLLALLLAGCAQLDALQLPAHAALDATVEATRALGRPHQAGLVNALLRRAQREGFRRPIRPRPYRTGCVAGSSPRGRRRRPRCSRRARRRPRCGCG